MDCPFRTPQGSCQHVDRGVGTGELIVLHEDVCQYCIKNFEDPETRATAATVTHSIYAERIKRKLPAKLPPPLVRKPTTALQRREHKKRPGIADEMLAVARAVPRRFPDAPIVADPKARLEICETDCDYWVGERCKAPGCQTCKGRPRPEADKGRDCPIGKWKRPAKDEQNPLTIIDVSRPQTKSGMDGSDTKKE
jgi:hypothetical protein